MKKNIFLLFFSFLFFLSSAGCATIVTGTSQPIRFDSNPPGALVKDNGFLIGTTPCEIHLDRKVLHNISFEKEGYQTERVSLNRKFNGWFLGNIPFFPGFFVDLITGANKWINPTGVMVQLKGASDKKPAPKNTSESMPEPFIPGK